jgi:hypothetical protein
MGATAQEPGDGDPSAERRHESGPPHQRPPDGSPDHVLASYAPKARHPHRAPSEFRAEPPWRLPGQPGAFAGDSASGLRTPIQPELAPSGPVRSFSGKGWLIGIALLAGGAGGLAGGYVLRAGAPDQPPLPAEAPRAAIQAKAPVPPRENLQAQAQAQAVAPRLAIDTVRVRRADEPIPLSISSTNAGANVSVVIFGLAPGSALSAGVPLAPNAWRLAGSDLGHAVLKPPQGFLGPMNLIVELRLADETVVDRKRLQLEWAGESVVAPVAAQPAQKIQERHLDASAITLLMQRGADYVSNGNIGAARMMFEPAAEAGDPAAAFALAETYDPVALERLGAKGITSDVALARRWYEQAKALGSTAASERLATLTR